MEFDEAKWTRGIRMASSIAWLASAEHRQGP